MTSFPGTMEEVRDFFEAVTRNLNSAPRPANERPKKNKRRPSVLPTMFLKKKKTEKHAKEQSWDKDIICLPPNQRTTSKILVKSPYPEVCIIVCYFNS